jgi:hypothetical protein
MNIIMGKKNQYVITEKDVITDQEKKGLNRSPSSFYISENISKGWRRYCELSGAKTHLLTESAFIEYMQRHPIPQVTLSVTKDLAAYAPSVKERLQNKIVREKIAAVIAVIRRHQRDRVEWRAQRTQLQKLVMQATKLRKPDGDLLDLLRQAEELV